MIIPCAWCGKEIDRPPCKIKKHNFCSRTCLAAFSSKSKNPAGYQNLKDYTGMRENMAAINRELNPTRMTPEVKAKLREARLRLGGKPLSTEARVKIREAKIGPVALNDQTGAPSYAKFHGRHLHRIVAELKLGRPLNPGEVVHHIDNNKRNNSPDNLMVFASQAEHAKWHKEHDKEVVK